MLEQGQIIDGRYEILGRVGAGSMGVVYRARHRRLERIVALKVPFAERMRDPSARRRFAREAEAGARLSHENIVTIHDVRVDDDDEADYICMEYIQGDPVDQYLKTNKRSLTVGEVSNLILQMGSAVDAAHAASVIHRDLKPDNILVERKRHRVKILDFGVARLVDAASLTVEGSTLGTPYYMSPEQALGRDPSPACDIYSLAAVLYYLLTDTRPFEGDVAAVLYCHAHQQAPRADERNARLAPCVADALDEALRKNPLRRPTSCERLCERIATGLEPLSELPWESLFQADSKWDTTVKARLVIAADDKSKAANDENSTLTNAPTTARSSGRAAPESPGAGEPPPKKFEITDQIDSAPILLGPDSDSLPRVEPPLSESIATAAKPGAQGRDAQGRDARPAGDSPVSARPFPRKDPSIRPAMLIPIGLAVVGIALIAVSLFGGADRRSSARTALAPSGRISPGTDPPPPGEINAARSRAPEGADRQAGKSEGDSPAPDQRNETRPPAPARTPIGEEQQTPEPIAPVLADQARQFAGIFRESIEQGASRLKEGLELQVEFAETPPETARRAEGPVTLRLEARRLVDHFRYALVHAETGRRYNRYTPGRETIELDWEELPTGTYRIEIWGESRTPPWGGAPMRSAEPLTATMELVD